MSDFHLDDLHVLANFEQVLQGYQDVLLESDGAIHPPALWILCGNFSQKPFVFDGPSITYYQSLFSKLADSLSKFPRVTRHIHFIFVPGPHDPWISNTLPRRALPPSIVKPLLHSSVQIPPGHLHFASNPCRIRWMSQELVIYRENLASKMCRNVIDTLKDPTAATDDETIDITKYLVQTILDQAHLSPFAISVSPVIWEHDQALRLYPMPTALVLADSYPAYNLTYEGCHVFNPGSFGVGSRPVWANYHVATRMSEQSELSL